MPIAKQVFHGDFYVIISVFETLIGILACGIAISIVDLHLLLPLFFLSYLDMRNLYTFFRFCWLRIFLWFRTSKICLFSQSYV